MPCCRSAAGGAAGAGGGVLQLKAANGAAGAGLAGAALDGDLHGLFLQPQQQQQQQQQLLVKREPEDLSHRKQQPSPGLAGESKGCGAGGRSSSNGSSGSTKLVLANGVTDVVDVIKDEYKTMAYSTQMFGGQPTPQGHHGSGTPSPGPYNDLQYAAAPPGPGHGGPNQPVYMSPVHVPNLRTAPPPPPPTSTGFTTVSERYYTDYFPPVPEQGYAPLRQQIPTYMDSAGAEAANGPTAVSAADLVQRYVRQTTTYHQNKSVISAATGLTVDLPSPDSGIGAEAITPRDQTAIQQSFDYTDLCSGQGVLDPLTVRPPSQVQSPGPQSGPGQPAPPRSRPWHDFGRQNDADKIQIPKLYSSYGFKYTLETPISTSQRREDDRVTYINKGQFYGITMEYIPDPDAPMLKNHTVKSVVMLMFREEKSPEDEIKAWQFWHGRQHSVKQRILDADTKNSMGLVGCIEEVAHNAIAVYWNPLESPAKINVAVQCLSTDFSSQKGVKGLPLHIQIDTYEDPRDGPVYHRGYCQIKVFCDKGAERKTRDEERRAAKRKMTATGRKKLDELYHPAAERTEFYCMADLHKPPVLFTPSEEMTSMELQGFYGHDTDNSSIGLKSTGPPGAGASPFLLHSAKPLAHQTLKFHNHFPPDAPCVKKEHSSLEPEPLSTDGGLFNSQAIKRPRLTPPLTERVMLYVRQESEDVYTPLHVVPPSTQGLLNAIENKYKISPSSISNLYRKNKKGIMVKIDDEMVKHYCNEDLFILEVKRDTHTDEEELYEITLIELPSP
ncbi:hypothetical protein ONE63_010892 [Megalurothrips usitatus]|uniref:Grh/CP2 DB domain-containing protein n=1 Tax=Megalurothrips usitatus TaxID=439358 RepID=A0AAV7XIG4_9NEOP|nr:hypothetical protein ONE63_010892 [Megalurothrips usitatus]